MKKYMGNSIYSAVAIGKVLVFKHCRAEVKRIRVDDPEAEKLRLEKAKEQSINQLREIYEKALKEVGESNAWIFEIHMMLINDTDYNESLMNIIENQSMNAEYAVSVTSDNFVAMFGAMEDSYMKARAADVKDISDRLLNNLILGDSSCALFDEENVIVCADDLAPSETILLDKSKVLGFVTAFGSVNSHTAILARNMNIPAIIGVGEELLKNISDGDAAIADGFTGDFYIDPDKETVERLTHKRAEEEEKRRFYRNLKGKENITKDGREIEILANIEGVSDIGSVLLNDAGGIGLFRSEFLFLESSDLPTEEQQFNSYKKVLESMAGKKVVIRTLDIGGNKQADYFQLEKEGNPALGCRAIRFCFSHPEVFRTQLRALYRASAYGNLGIMFPMITSPDELNEIFGICREIKHELAEREQEYAEDIELGIMIETPAAAIISDRLAPMVDFFGVGTNDLTQYTLACDRDNPNMDKYNNPYHEAVMRLIAMAAESARKNGVRIGICGDLGADVNLTETFLRMGIDALSVAPGMVLKLRDKVRSLDLSK